MAWPFRGNINGTVISGQNNLPMILQNYYLVNKTGGAVTVNVYLINGDQEISISPLNKSISNGEIYENDRPTVILATQQIKVQTGGSIDYDFYFDNTEAP